MPAKRSYNLIKKHQEKLSLTANRWREQASTVFFFFLLEIKSDVVSLALLVASIVPILWLWFSCRAFSYSHKSVRGGLFPIHVYRCACFCQAAGKRPSFPQDVGVSRSSLTSAASISRIITGTQPDHKELKFSLKGEWGRGF